MAILIDDATKNKNEIYEVIAVTYDHLAKGAITDFKNIMTSTGRWIDAHWNDTKHQYKFATGTIIRFTAVDKIGKAKGPRRTKLYCNEANLINFEIYHQLASRTSKDIYIDFNPTARFWAHKEVLGDNDSEFLLLTYMDNQGLPDNVLNDFAVAREKAKTSKYWLNYCRVYIDGLVGKLEGTIFDGWTFLDEKPEKFVEYVYGVDFGFVHNMALTKVWYTTENEIYIEPLIYESGLRSNDMLARFNELGVDKNVPMLCDYARPELIADLVNDGYNAMNADKSVKAGLNAVAKMTVFAAKHEGLITEYNNYKWKVVNGEAIDEPEKKFDDCFIGDTLITTQNGDVKIKDIEVGDMVLTSNGYRRVLHKFRIGEKLVSDYSLLYDTHEVNLTCTNNHKIKTQDKWTEISKLKSGTTTFHIKPSTVLNTNYTVGENTLCNTSTTCTKKFGNTTMVKEEKDITSITLMEILGITELKTWQKLKHTNITQYTQKQGLNLIQNGQKNFIQKELSQQKNGINHQKDLSGIDNMQLSLVLENKLMERENVKCVQQNILPMHHIKDSVQTNANQNLEEIVELIILQENAYYAEMNSSPTNMIKQNIVDVEVKNERFEYVYDLMVEETHEFFANGILVHNCMDANRYACKYIETYANFSYDTARY